MSEKKRGLATALAKKLGQDLIPTAREEHTSARSVLMHPVRFCIFLTTFERPGMTLHQITRETEVPLTSTKRHLDILEEAGLLTIHHTEGKTHHFPPIMLSETECGQICALADPVKSDIYNIVDRGESSVVKIAKAARMKAPSASYQLNILVEAGLVKNENRKYVSTDMLDQLRTKMENRSVETAENIIELLKQQNLSPSGTRKYKNRIRVEVTLGEERRRATVYTVPVTLG